MTQPKAKVKAEIWILVRDKTFSGSWVSKEQTKNSYTEDRLLPKGQFFLGHGWESLATDQPQADQGEVWG